MPQSCHNLSILAKFQIQNFFPLDSLQSEKLEGPTTSECLPGLFSKDLTTLCTLKTVTLSSVIAKLIQITEMPLIMYLYAYEKRNIDFMI